MDWSEVRTQLLTDPEVAYLNTGSYGLLPRPVFEQVTEYRRRLAAEPFDFLIRQVPKLLWIARARLAQYLGTVPERLVFTANVTAAINTVARGLRLDPESEVLITDHEYGAMRYCWEHVAARRGWQWRELTLPVLPDSPQEIVACFEQQISERTRVLFFSHMLPTTGMVLPVQQICRLARDRGIVTVIDGAHGPGLLPLQLDHLGCDYYCGNCHKWLLAPTGAGFLYLGEGHQQPLDPLVVSWGYKTESADAHARDEFGSTATIRRLEFQGTRDPSPWLTVPAVLDFRSRIGEAAIHERIRELSRYARRRLGERNGWPLRTPEHRELAAGITAFRLPSEVPDSLPQMLWEQFRIEVPVVQAPVGRLLRVSTHFYNDHEQIDRLAEALQTFAHNGRHGG